MKKGDLSLNLPSLYDVRSRRFAVTYENVTVVVVKGVRLFKTKEGQIFADRAVSLDGSWCMNDVIRRAYCNLAGIKFEELRKAIKAHRDAETKKDQSRAVERLRAQSSRLGYKLVK